MTRRFAQAEELVASLALLAMVVLPLGEILVRRFGGGGIPGSASTVQHLTLWVGFLGAAIAAREGKLLALATGSLLPEGRFHRFADWFAAASTAAVAALLVWGGVDLVLS